MAAVLRCQPCEASQPYVNRVLGNVKPSNALTVFLKSIAIDYALTLSRAPNVRQASAESFAPMTPAKTV